MKPFLMILVAMALAGCSFGYTPPSKKSDLADDTLADSWDSNDGETGNETEFNPPLIGDVDTKPILTDTEVVSVYDDGDIVHPLSETDAGETILPVDTTDADLAETTDTQEAETDTSLPCIPNCAGKQCGDDNCNGSCGICSDNFTCTVDFVCECVVGCQIPAEPTADADAGTTTTDAKADNVDAADASPDETGAQPDADTEAEVTILPPPVDIVVNAEPSADTNVAGLDTILLPDITPIGPDTTPSVDTGLICVPQCDNKQCGDDGCGNECGVCDSNSCVKSACINDACVDTLVNCDDSNQCTDDDCDPIVGCGHTNNTVACDDKDACTTGDTCVDGTCQSNEFIVCEDINPCTNNTCDSGQGCIFVYNTAPCEDGNVLTIGDQCQEGQCFSGQSQECDDSNPCTDDVADMVNGCLHKANTAPCSDKNLCTVKDTCKNNVCVSGDVLNCNDDNECTDEVCNSEKGCLYTYNSATCDNNDACTSVDKCVSGKCLGVASLSCDDNNQCTLDTCNQQNGCQHEQQTGKTCNDGNACTKADSCKQDVCSGETITCNDYNPCTDDSCDEQSGCVYAPNNANPCEDGSLCTTGDFCADGKCQGVQALTCDDDNGCTDNVCQPQKGCIYPANQAGCDDGNGCTVGDICADKSCASGTNICQCANTADCATAEDNNLCNGTLICDTNAMPFQCVVNPDTIITCNASQDTVCLKNICVPATGVCQMKAVNDGNGCDDNNACTKTDACSNGVCSGASIKCDDSNVCTDDSCVPTSGCVFTPNTVECDDGTVCTIVDICQWSKCVGTAPLDCDDDKECTLDICHKTLGCQHSKTALNGQACDNGDACTVNDTCQNGACQAGTQNNCECYTTVDCAGKEDGNFCNGTLKCDTAVMPHKCVLDQSTIITCPATSDTTCSKNTCQPVSGKCEMKAVNEGGGCDDGNPCTADDFCESGLCKSTPKPTGTVIFQDNFDDGNIDDWTVETWNTCPNCSICPCTLPTVAVTDEAPFWVKMSPLAGSGHVLFTSPATFLPKGGSINFLFAGASCVGGSFSKCVVQTGGNVLGYAISNDCTTTPPSCPMQFSITKDEKASQVILECTGVSVGGDPPIACGAIYLDDFSITCP